MSSTLPLSHHELSDLSAWLFWLYVRQVGLEPCRDEVITTRGGCLLVMRHVDFVRRSGVNGLLGSRLMTTGGRKAMLSAAAREAFESVAAGRWPVGPVYADEAMAGRDFSAARFPDPALPPYPPRARVVGIAMPRMGQLLLRSPLPAATIVSDPEPPPLFQIASVTDAMGRDYPAIMLPEQIAPVSRSRWAVHGPIYMPAASHNQGDDLLQMIPNGQFSRDGHLFHTPAGLAKVNYDWSA